MHVRKMQGLTHTLAPAGIAPTGKQLGLLHHIFCWLFSRFDTLLHLL